MMEREKALSTWLGAGVAMPHCSKEGIDLVRQTGFQLLQFPDGVGWGRVKWPSLWSPWRQKTMNTLML